MNGGRDVYHRKINCSLPVLMALVFSTWSGGAALAADYDLVGLLALAMEPEVAEQIGLTQNQREQLSQLIADKESELLVEAEKVKNLSREQRNAWLADFRYAVENQGLTILSVQQRAKLEQIRLKRFGAKVLTDPVVMRRLEVSPEQAEALQESITASGTGSEASTATDLEGSKVVSLLDEKQRKTFREMLLGQLIRPVEPQASPEASPAELTQPAQPGGAATPGQPQPPSQSAGPQMGATPVATSPQTAADGPPSSAAQPGLAPDTAGSGEAGSSPGETANHTSAPSATPVASGEQPVPAQGQAPTPGQSGVTPPVGMPGESAQAGSSAQPGDVGQSGPPAPAPGGPPTQPQGGAQPVQVPIAATPTAPPGPANASPEVAQGAPQGTVAPTDSGTNGAPPGPPSPYGIPGSGNTPPSGWPQAGPVPPAAVTPPPGPESLPVPGPAPQASNLSPSVADTATGTVPLAQGGSDRLQLPPADVKLRFNFRYQPWKDVLDWLVQQAGFSLVMDSPPPGTFNYVDDREYTPSEAIDLLNSVLLTKGYVLVRRERMLMLFNVEDGIPPNFLETVKPEDLDSRGDYELVNCLFQLRKMTPEEAELEVKKLLGPQGSVVVLAKARQLLVTETAGKLKTIRRMIDAIENPAEGGLVRTFRINPSSIDQVLSIVRQMFEIPADQMATTDGSLRLAVDPTGSRLLVSGTPEMLDRFSELLQVLDPRASETGDLLESTPQLEVYPITSADPQMVLQVMQTLLGGMPDVRLAIDSKTGALVAWARPAQHATIRATLQQLQGEVGQMEVIPLRVVDPQLAVLAISKLFGTPTDGSSGSTSNAPTVDADLSTRMLLVRGTRAQIDQIKQLLTKMGEPPMDGTAGPVNLMRTIPMDAGTAQAVLNQMQSLWPQIRENRLQIIRGVTPSESNGSSGEATSQSATPASSEQKPAASDIQATRIPLPGALTTANRLVFGLTPLGSTTTSRTTSSGAKTQSAASTTGSAPTSPGESGSRPPFFGPFGGPGGGPGGWPGREGMFDRGRDWRHDHRDQDQNEGDHRDSRSTRVHPPLSDDGLLATAPEGEKASTSIADQAVAATERSNDRASGGFRFLLVSQTNEPPAAGTANSAPPATTPTTPLASPGDSSHTSANAESAQPQTPAGTQPAPTAVDSAAPFGGSLQPAAATGQSEGAAGQSDGAAGQSEGATGQSDGAAGQSSPAAPATGQTPQQSPPVVVAVTPEGLVIASQDAEALTQFENLVRRMVNQQSQVQTTPELVVYYLKHSRAENVGAILDQILGGGTLTTSGSTSGSLVGEIARAAFGNVGGGLVGSLLGVDTGGSTSSSSSTRSTASRIQITPDSRLNALIVQAYPQDLQLIEEILRVLDQPDSPQEVAVQPKTIIIPVKNTQAEEIATILRSVYQDRLVTSGGSSNRTPDPREIIQLLRGGRGGQAGGRTQPQQEVQRMSIGVDTRTNSLIISAPEKLLKEVQDLVAQLDQKAVTESEETTQVVTLQRANAESVRAALSALLGSDVQMSSSRSSSSSRSYGSSSSGSSSFRGFGSSRYGSSSRPSSSSSYRIRSGR